MSSKLRMIKRVYKLTKASIFGLALFLLIQTFSTQLTDFSLFGFLHPFSIFVTYSWVIAIGVFLIVLVL